MKPFFPLVLAFSCLGASAQVTITDDEMPHAGDLLWRTRAFTNPFIDFATTGPNHAWDFSGLGADTQDSADYMSVGSTNLVYALVFADIFFNPNRANHAIAGTDIPFSGLLPIGDPYTFLYRSSSEYKKVGFGAELSGLPVPIIFDQHDVIYELPLDYGDASSSFSSWSVSLPTLFHYGYEQDRDVEVDGWGSITTPTGAFDVLRVKTTLAGRDTVNLDSLGIGFTIDRPLVREYKWLAENHRTPILQINTSEVFGFEVVTDIWFYDEPRGILVVPPIAALCPGSQVEVQYDETGVFNAGGFLIPANDFIVQLSDSTGDFANAVDIGSLEATTDSTILCTIPPGTPFGTGYRIRVISTSPDFIGADNGYDLTIGGAPVADAVAAGPTTFCTPGSVMLNGSGGDDYQWLLDGTAIMGATAPDLEATATGMYSLVASTGCGSDTSAAIAVVANVAPVAPVIQAAGATAFCDGGSVTLGIDTVPGASYQWSQDGIDLSGATSNELVVTTTGTYSVTVIAGNGCMVEAPAAVDVEVYPLPTQPVITQSADTLYASGSGSFQWMLFGSPIAGATDPWFQTYISGDYSVMLTDSNGCSSTSDPYAYISTGVPGTIGHGIAVHPNPNDGSFHLLAPPGARRYAIADPSGRVVMQGVLTGPPAAIHLRERCAGTYVLTVFMDDGSRALQRIVIR